MPLGCGTDKCVLMWRTNTPGFRLEFTTALPTTSWNPASPAPVILGGSYVVTDASVGNANSIG